MMGIEINGLLMLSIYVILFFVSSFINKEYRKNGKMEITNIIMELLTIVFVVIAVLFVPFGNIGELKIVSSMLFLSYIALNLSFCINMVIIIKKYKYVEN